MNRQKKLQSIYKARLKKHKAKLDGRIKPKYISKADRAKLEAEQVSELTRPMQPG